MDMYADRILTLRIAPPQQDHLTETDVIATLVGKKMEELLDVVGNSLSCRVKYRLRKIGNDKDYNYNYRIKFSQHEIDEELCVYFIDFLFEIVSLLGENGDNFELINLKIEEAICVAEYFGAEFSRDAFTSIWQRKIEAIERKLKTLGRFRYSIYRNWRPVDVCTLFGVGQESSPLELGTGSSPEQLSLGRKSVEVPVVEGAEDNINGPESGEEALDDEPCIETITVEIDLALNKGQHVIVWRINGKRSNLRFRPEASDKLLNHIKVHGLGNVVLDIDLNASGFGGYYVVDVCTEQRPEIAI